MDVKAVNSVSLQQQNFEAKPNRNKNNAEYPQMDSPASKQASKAITNSAIGSLTFTSKKSKAKNTTISGLAALAILSGGMGTGMTSCVKENAWAVAGAEANAWAWGWIINNNGCNCKPDTIFQTTPIREVNWAANDSIKNQFINIGAEVDGPVDGDNVLLVSGKFRNQYDNKITEFQVDSTECNTRQMVYVSKVTDLYDPKNPKKQWIKTIAKDVPGRGIKYEFYTTNSTEKPEPWQYNQSYSVIVSNGARGNKPGINTIYDKDGQMIWQGQLTKGQQAGAFTYGTFALDEEGNPYINPETGEPELIDYNFDNCKIFTREVEWGKFKQPTKLEDYDYDLWH